MIKYSFLLSEQTEDFDSRPCIQINSLNLDIDIDNDLFLNSELNHLSSEYIRQIVKEIQEVKKWEKERVEFWFETTSIHVLKKKYKAPNWKFYPGGLVRISYNYGDDYVETDLKIDDILKMMTDYRDFVDAWEKETEKLKK